MLAQILEEHVNVGADCDRLGPLGGGREFVAAVPYEINRRDAVPLRRHERFAIDQNRRAIHPVAGRMPGHMNVLLAEADVPYEKLLEMEQANEEFPTTDVVLVLGANDVVNPAAKNDPASPIYGMPILDVELAKLCIINKRSMKPGYAGIENDLFFRPKSSMLFGDAKKVLQDLIAEVKNL